MHIPPDLVNWLRVFEMCRYLSQFFQSAGQALPSTLLMPSQTLAFYLSDEIFALHAPILVTIDASSTAILNIELASDRSADTWRTHFKALEKHHFCSLGMASDRGLGLVAGYQAACAMALWVADYFHEFRDLFALLHQLERKAYAAIDKEDDALQKFDRAKSEATLAKRLQQYETAHHACEQAMALYDQLAMLLHLLREALQLCSPHGRLRTVEAVRSELTLLFHMLEELDCADVTKTLEPIKKHIDDVVVPFAHAEAIDAELGYLCPTPEYVAHYIFGGWAQIAKFDQSVEAGWCCARQIAWHTQSAPITDKEMLCTSNLICSSMAAARRRLNSITRRSAPR